MKITATLNRTGTDYKISEKLCDKLGVRPIITRESFVCHHNLMEVVGKELGPKIVITISKDKFEGGRRARFTREHRAKLKGKGVFILYCAAITCLKKIVGEDGGAFYFSVENA